MNLCFLRSCAASEAYAPPAGVDPSSALFICPDELTRLHCSASAARTFLLTDDPWELRRDFAANHFCRRLAESWYLDLEGKDFTLVDGTSLGKALEHHAWCFYLTPIYKFLHAVQGLLASERPEILYAETGLPARRRSILETLSRASGVTLRWLGRPEPAKPDDASWLPSPQNSKWPLRDDFWKRRILNRVAAAGSPRKGPRLLVSYYPFISPLIEAIGEEPGFQPVFFAWPGRALFKLPRWKRWRFLQAPQGTGPMEKNPFPDRMRKTWEGLAASSGYARRFVFQGISCLEQLRPVLGRVLAEDIPFLAAELARLRSALDACPPDMVLIPYDAPPPERLLVQEARRRGIPSVLVLHGLPCRTYDRIYDTNADYLFIGGEGPIGLYDAAGVSPARIRVTGYPIMDRYAGLRPAPPAKPTRILVIGNMLKVEENIGTVVELLRPYRDIEVTIKLHPNESIDLYRRILGARLDARFRLKNADPFQETLRDKHLVIGSVSTALIEAMAMGIPVINVNLEHFKAAPPFDGKCGIPSYETREELSQAFARILPDRIPQADYSRFLETYAGKLDGRCVGRNLRALKEVLAERSSRPR